MKAIIFTSWFEPPDELVELCSSLGYTDKEYQKNFDLMFDSRVVEFCEQRLTTSHDNKSFYKGKESTGRRRIFKGAGFIREIDTTKKWVLKATAGDWLHSPVVCYVDVCVNKYGYTTLEQKE